MKTLLRKIIIAAVLLAIWQAAAVYINLEVLLPSPISVARAFIDLCTRPDFYKTNAFSFLRVLGGFGLGVLFGLVFGSLSSRFVWVKDSVSMLMSIIKAAPVASFIILALVWLQKGRVPIFASFLIVAPMVFSSVYTGILHTLKDLIEMSDAFGVKGPKRISKLYVPSVLPYFISASSTALGMAWKAGIAAEVIASPAFSIGGHMNDAKIYLNTSSLLAWTLSVIILSLLLETILRHIAKKKGVSMC